VRFSHEDLFRRPEERKILIVITDGQGDTVNTKEQIKSGERLGITTLGIGVELDVSDTYTQYVNIKDLQDLANASFKQIKLAI